MFLLGFPCLTQAALRVNAVDHLQKQLDLALKVEVLAAAPQDSLPGVVIGGGHNDLKSLFHMLFPFHLFEKTEYIGFRVHLCVHRPSA